jgi:hypothetical protein
VRGNPQPQKFKSGRSQDQYFSAGIIESMRRERHPNYWLEVTSILGGMLRETVGKNDRFHQALLDESAKHGHNLETLTSSHLLDGDRIQSSAEKTQLREFVCLFFAVLM